MSEIFLLRQVLLSTIAPPRIVLQHFGRLENLSDQAIAEASARFTFHDGWTSRNADCPRSRTLTFSGWTTFRKWLSMCTVGNSGHKCVAAWPASGPPRDCSNLATNSWLYVPLLHAAAGGMPPDLLQQWRTDPRAVWWEDARRDTRCVPTRSPSAPSPKPSSLPPTPPANRRLSMSSRRQPPCRMAPHAHRLGRAPRAQRHDGYITALCQEACLELFGGRAFAADLDRASDALEPLRLRWPSRQCVKMKT